MKKFLEYKLYEVGGKIRDEVLGLESKDVDYSVVLDNSMLTMELAFTMFVKQLKSEGFEVFLENIDCVTVRAMFPKDHKYKGVADFVLARKEISYPEGGRQPICKLGTLRDDLLRRDFTLNAMAKGDDGKIIDLFGGHTDLMNGVLRTPVDPLKTLSDDPLRIIRAMRFAITKDFTLAEDLREAIIELGTQGLEKVSMERIREELFKCFRFDTLKTIDFMNYMAAELNFPIARYVFEDTPLWLKPTTKE